tara:strand:+ start:1127 stop:1858 length:732 start_codon:yes stop_codon:yes gene_type:complete
MSKIRLHGSSSGYTEIAPVAASGNNTLTLPNDGTIISKDSNGAVGVTSITVGTGVTIGDGRVTCTTVHGSAASLTSIPAANIVGVCTSGLTKTGGFGKVVQYKYDQYNALLETTGTNYQDWSSYFSVTITPTSSTNLLVACFDFQGCVYHVGSSDANARVALTDDGASSYLFENDVRYYDYGGSGGFINMPFSIEHVKVAGSTSARTYAIRVKLVAGAKFVINNYSGSAGTNNSVLSVMEIEP